MFFFFWSKLLGRHTFCYKQTIVFDWFRKTLLFERDEVSETLKSIKNVKNGWVIASD